MQLLHIPLRGKVTLITYHRQSNNPTAFCSFIFFATQEPFFLSHFICIRKTRWPAGRRFSENPSVLTPEEVGAAPQALLRPSSSAGWSLTHAALTRHLRAGLVRPHQGVGSFHKFRADVCGRSFWEQERVDPGKSRKQEVEEVHVGKTFFDYYIRQITAGLGRSSFLFAHFYLEQT